MQIDSLDAALAERGFAIIERHLDDATLARTLRCHAESIANADPRDVSRSSSGGGTRVHLVEHHPDLDALYLDPTLLSVAARVLQIPFGLSAFLSRTIHPGASAQALHVDQGREGDALSMLGFIYMLDDFRADNGATRFVPGSHRTPSSSEYILATAPAGSLIVYDGAVLHGFNANTSGADRRSIQGAFVARSARAFPSPPRRAGRSDLARYLLSNPLHAEDSVEMPRLTEAIEASWDHRTAYRGISSPGNLALGQCYPTARVVQWFFPELEIASGEVWTGASTEDHFWNVRTGGDAIEHIDLSWRQFPPGSSVRKFKVLDRHALGDSPATVERCALLLQRVLVNLAVS
jgi:Phytanoyl-CoA dioxygenase (PhyH)